MRVSKLCQNKNFYDSFKLQYLYRKYNIHNRPGWEGIIEGQFLQAIWDLEGKCSETEI